VIKSIDPTPQSVKRLMAKVPAGVPVVMLNLLRFRERAVYPPELDLAPCSGRDAYAAYAKNASTHLANVGAKVIWKAQAKHSFIAPVGEEWDEIMLVAYPSRDAFMTMLKSPDYQAITMHRTAALADARLLVTV
jgi:uncharacterized protein (DUF1330 family)